MSVAISSLWYFVLCKISFFCFRPPGFTRTAVFRKIASTYKFCPLFQVKYPLRRGDLHEKGWFLIDLKEANSLHTKVVGLLFPFPHPKYVGEKKHGAHRTFQIWNAFINLSEIGKGVSNEFSHIYASFSLFWTSSLSPFLNRLRGERRIRVCVCICVEWEKEGREVSLLAEEEGGGLGRLLVSLLLFPQMHGVLRLLLCLCQSPAAMHRSPIPSSQSPFFLSSL